MISVDLARSLALAGLRWHPAPGDRFTLEAEDLDDAVFTVSELTIEVHEYPTGTVLGFNGTTEWALDSVDMGQTLWLPSEEQLRTLLGATFVSLVRQPDGWTVTTRLHDELVSWTAPVAAEAYGTALHALIMASSAVAI